MSQQHLSTTEELCGHVHIPLNDYFAGLLHHRNLDVNALVTIIDFLIDHDLDDILNMLVSEPHVCYSGHLPYGVDGDDLPTIDDLLDNWFRDGELEADELACIRGLISDKAGIPHLLSLQIMVRRNY